MRRLYTLILAVLCLPVTCALAQPVLVEDINKGEEGRVFEMMPFNGKLYFQSEDAVNGKELWEYNGNDTKGSELWKYTDGMACLDPTVSISPSMATEGAPTTFTDASTNVDANATYSWDFDGDGVEDATTVGSTSHTYTEAGVYSATLTITNPGGCVSSTTVNVIVSIGDEDFNEIVKKVADDREAEAQYGVSVAISGDYAIVGAINEDHDVDGTSNPLTNAGAAYILKKDVNGNWQQIKKIVAADRGANDNFGFSVSISSDYAIVGSQKEDHDVNGGNYLVSSGSAYIFQKDEGGTDNWGQVKKITASDRAESCNFGNKVSISGNYIIVAAAADDGNGGNAGAAYLFEKDEGGPNNWGQLKKLIPADIQAGDEFGRGLSIAGDYIIVGADREDALGSNAGAAYIFQKDQGGVNNWGQVKKLTASDGQANDWFGSAAAISGDYALVGAHQENSGGSLAGAAYLFGRNEGGENNWGEIKKLTASDAAAGDKFGFSLSISGDYAVISAREEEEGGTNAGAIYVFRKDEGGVDNWGQTGKHIASDIQNEDRFGHSAGISGEYLIVGAIIEDHDENGANPLSNAGSAYFFKACQIPVAAFTASTAVEGNATTFTDASTNVDANATYSWDFDNDGTEDDNTAGNTSYTYPAGGTYTAKLTITNPGGCTNSTTVPVSVAYVENAWTPLGPDDASEPGFSSSNAAYTAIAIDGNDVPYVAYLNGTAIGNTIVTAEKFENGSWVTVGSGDFSAGHADFISIAIDGNDMPYVAYRDYANSSKATVQKFDGANWSAVGSSGFSASTANNTEIAIDGNNTPYIVYQDASTNFKAMVQKFEGGSWQAVGGGSASGSTAQYTDIAIDGNNVPYIVYKDGGLSDKITVQKFEGGSWTIVGSAGFSVGAVEYTTIAIDENNTPYVAYQDIGNGGGITVQKFDGSNWGVVGSNNFSAGAATYTSIAIHSNNVPFVLYKDGANSNKATAQQFDGNNWITVGSAGFTANEAAFPSLAIDGTGKLIVAYGSPGAYTRYYLPSVVCAPPVVSFTASTAVAGTPTSFTDASTANAGATYSWDFDNNGTEDATTVGDVGYTYLNTGTYTARLTITDGGCISSSTITVNVFSQLEEGILWADDAADKIQGAALDGSNVSDLVSGINPRGIDVDMQGRKMYWVDDLTDKVQRANFDGTGVEDIITGQGMVYPYGVAIDETNRKIYWTDLTAQKIRRANLDGSVVEDLITSNLNSPFGIVVDEANSKLYWTDYTLGEVRRANLDGTGVEVLISGLNQPFGIALDNGNGKIYFTDVGADKLQRADLDGMNLEDVITGGLSGARGIEINESEGKIYWTDLSNDKIQRANLDGTDIEELVSTGLADPGDLALILCDFELSLSSSTVTQGMPTPFTVSTTGLSGTPAYSWDFDNDGNEDDTTAGNTSYTYPAAGNYTASLLITNDLGCKKSILIDVAVDFDPFTNIDFDDLLKTVTDDRNSGDQFGYSVAISGNYAIIGAYNQDYDVDGTSNLVYNAGAAYIFKKDEGGLENWGLVKKLVAADRKGSDQFGYSVAISGEYAIVGAKLQDYDVDGASNYMVNTGAAYIFKKDQGGTDNWGQVRKLVAADRYITDEFGVSVAISGGYAIVGARQEDEDVDGVSNYLYDAGSAYIFKQSLGGVDNWGQLKKLVPNNRDAGDYWGQSVSISGDYAIVGSRYEDQAADGISDFMNASGAAHIFKKDQGGTDNWGQVKKLVASDRAPTDYFGYSVSISGDYAIVGAYQEDHAADGSSDFLSDAGSAYIFKRDEGGIDNWGELKKIVPMDREAGDNFGYSVSISENYTAVGSWREAHGIDGSSDPFPGAGSAYLFKKTEGGTDNWGLLQKVVAVDRQADDNFGHSVAAADAFVLVGANSEDHDVDGVSNELTDAGAAYFFKNMNSAALPVELLGFEARKEDAAALLSWQTATEVNNKGFNIQRSADGREWRTLGFVPGSGTPSQGAIYRYIDPRPLNGINYYRLKQEDYDGGLSYSVIRSIYFEGAGRDARVYPNPFSTFLTIENGQGALTVYDMLGRVLEQRAITEAVYRLDTGALPNGPCIIRLQRNDGRLYAMRLVKTAH